MEWPQTRGPAGGDWLGHEEASGYLRNYTAKGGGLLLLRTAGALLTGNYYSAEGVGGRGGQKRLVDPEAWTPELVISTRWERRLRVGCLSGGSREAHLHPPLQPSYPIRPPRAPAEQGRRSGACFQTPRATPEWDGGEGGGGGGAQWRACGDGTAHRLASSAL